MLFMLNRELMVRGDAVRENQSLVSFRKSCIARLERKLAECRSRKKQLQTEADALYESYAGFSDFGSKKVKKVCDINLTYSGFGSLCISDSLST